MTMVQVAWAAIGLLAVTVIGMFGMMFQQNAKMDAGFRDVNARIDALNAALSSRIDALYTALQAHIGHHAG